MKELERLVEERIKTKNKIKVLQDLNQYDIIQLELNKTVQKDMELQYQLIQLLNYKENEKGVIKLDTVDELDLKINWNELRDLYF